MKRSSILVLCVLAFFVNACEKHPVSQLPPDHATEFGEHAWSPGQGKKHGGDHGAAAAAAPHASAPAPEGKPGEAPKFFQK